MEIHWTLQVELITIHYDDGSKDENVSIADGIQDGSITVDTQYASNGTKKGSYYLFR